MRVIHSFFHAMGFLTRLPVPKRLEASAWATSPPWYPVVGLLIGGILTLGNLLLQEVAPAAVASMILLTLWVFLTGGLHLDGLMDTADGFGSYRSRERILEIMKDSRVGGMGVLASILLLGNKFAALSVLQGQGLLCALLLAPVLGRGAMMAALYYVPYAREEGLAQSLRSAGRVGRFVSFLFSIACLIGVAWFVGGKVVLLTCVCAGLAFALLVRSSLRKIGGATGDVYGALCEVTEAVVLIAFVIGERLSWM